MRLKKLFENLSKCKKNKILYYFKWRLRFKIDDEHYYFAFLPTITYLPWIYKYPNLKMEIFDIWWLNMHILIGEFGLKDKSNDLS